MLHFSDFCDIFKNLAFCDIQRNGRKKHRHLNKKIKGWKHRGEKPEQWIQKRIQIQMIRYQRRESRECNWQLKGHFAANSLKEPRLIWRRSMFNVLASSFEERWKQTFWKIFQHFGILWNSMGEKASTNKFRTLLV